ncbi:hypothetical protein C5167_008545 [Papaver somniferum]|uniref:Uncharacterized protein n=1 Tax=Papaver somniferum TaxID=3469 RepID=A0A4Y7JUV1_PAPSO|nr:hypothetical protein C5167_008545 [Papaver somniferum]
MESNQQALVKTTHLIISYQIVMPSPTHAHCQNHSYQVSLPPMIEMKNRPRALIKTHGIAEVYQLFRHMRKPNNNL